MSVIQEIALWLVFVIPLSPLLLVLIDGYRQTRGKK